MTKNLGRRGHIITDSGRRELEVAVAIDKVGFINSRIDELSYQMQFDESQMTGTVIQNTSLIHTTNIKETLDLIKRVMQANLGMGRYLKVEYSGQTIQHLKIPPRHIAIVTICSFSLNSILLRHGITMVNRFGGLLEYMDGQPVRFSQIISYDGSSIDPMEIFIKGRMTNVYQTLNVGIGCICASFREIPAASLPAAEQIIEKIEKMGLGGVLMMGKPNQPLLDIPVGIGRVGLIISAGLNPIAAVEETGIQTTNRALSDLCDFQQFKPYESLYY